MTAVALLLLGVIAAAVTAVLRLRQTGDQTLLPPSGPLRATALTTRRWRLVGLGSGLVVGTAYAQHGALGRGLLLAAPLCALCVLGGVVIGELRVTAPSEPVRRAVLEVRRVRDYVPARLGAVVLAATGALAVLLALTTVAGSPDDLGRAGRSLARQCSAVMTQNVGPWPGSFYALPLALVVLAGLLLAGLALRWVVRRPRSGEDTGPDDALRRQAAEAVTAGCGLLVAVPLGGVGFFAAHALGNLDCAPGWWTVPTVALGLLVPAMGALAAWCAAVLVVPGGREPAALDHGPAAQ